MYLYHKADRQKNCHLAIAMKRLIDKLVMVIYSLCFTSIKKRGFVPLRNNINS